MHVFMFYQTSLLTITHITRQRALNTMLAFMFYQTALLCECLVTHTLLKYKGAHHYEHIDVA